jgi:hypothetical protein
MAETLGKLSRPVLRGLAPSNGGATRWPGATSSGHSIFSDTGPEIVINSASQCLVLTTDAGRASTVGIARGLIRGHNCQNYRPRTTQRLRGTISGKSFTIRGTWVKHLT